MRSELWIWIKEDPIRNKTARGKGRGQSKAHWDLYKNSFNVQNSAEEADL